MLVVPDSASSPPIVRFAAFEFNPATGELRKHGLRIKLNGQPVQVLAALLEHPGEIVSREEIQKRLWQAETYVDFEHSLNAAIKRLRGALGDSADAPRYVETIARQGYRFIAPVNSSAPSHPIVSAEARPIPTTGQKASGPRKPAAWQRFVLPVTVAAVLVIITAALWLQKTEYFWRSPIAGAQFQTITDFDGVEQAAAMSRDGHFLAFLSDRGGRMDVWVTQIGSGQFHNLTQGGAKELANPSVHTVGFTPDGTLVTYWMRNLGTAVGGISVWAVPTLGGQQRLYLEGVSEFDWSNDGSRIAYHTPGPGDPLFVADSSLPSKGRRIFTAPDGLHSHFPLWAPNAAFIYFVQGSLPDKLDIWRIPSTGGTAERITSHVGRVSHPVLLDQRTLMYLASDPNGSGPWLYSMDVERRIPHRLTSGLDRYTSLAASADGRRLVVTRANPKRTLWRLRLGDLPAEASAANPIPLTTSTGFSPRLGPDYLVYVSATGSSQSIWKIVRGVSQELWSGKDAQFLGSPSVTSDGRQIAFSIVQRGRKLLYVMNADGTNVRIVSDSLDLQGTPAWEPGEQAITSAALTHGIPHLFRIPVNGRVPVPFINEYSVDPAWSPDSRFAIYSGADIGTTFPLKAVTAKAAPYPLPAMTLTRGARHVAFLPDGQALIYLRGEIQHKDLWLIDLATGTERQLTNLGPDFEIHDFDISPNGRDIVLERVKDRSDIVLLDLPPR